jgi:bifunctional DNA-binding transcriptional regulator/antitoxin component of YhaV-PrlF toxin-antitoxin module
MTGRRSVTIPAELCRELGIEPGDAIELSLGHGYLMLRRVGDAPPGDDSAVERAMGILGGYFESVEDVNRFIREGRGDWTEADEAEYQKNRRSRLDATSTD